MEDLLSFLTVKKKKKKMTVNEFCAVHDQRAFFERVGDKAA